MKQEVVYTVMVLADGVPISHVTLLEMEEGLGVEATVGGIREMQDEAAAVIQVAHETLKYAVFKAELGPQLSGLARNIIQRLQEGEEGFPPSPTANNELGDIPF